MNVNLIQPDELASGDLSRYGTIITGIRAYDVREDFAGITPGCWISCTAAAR